MTNQHPITPPPELVLQWASESLATQHLCTQAAQWGANQELEACCSLLDSGEHAASYGCHNSDSLRAARRPKPPSLKEQALRVLVENGTNLDGRMELDSADIEIISRALEALPND
jgi:hypothetical protein